MDKTTGSGGWYDSRPVSTPPFRPGQSSWPGVSPKRDNYLGLIPHLSTLDGSIVHNATIVYLLAILSQTHYLRGQYSLLNHCNQAHFSATFAIPSNEVGRALRFHLVVTGIASRLTLYYRVIYHISTCFPSYGFQWHLEKVPSRYWSWGERSWRYTSSTSHPASPEMCTHLSSFI